MGSAIPMPDEASQQYLDNARAEAVASLKGSGIPAGMLTPPSSSGIKTSVTQRSPQQQGIPAPGPSAQAAPPNPEPEPSPAPEQPQFGQDSDAQNTFWRATGEGITQGVPQAASEVTYGLLRGAVKTIANVLGFGGVAAHDMLSTQNLANRQDTDDQVFKMVDGIKSAADKYLVADQTNANPFATAAGSVAEGAAPLILGPEAGLPGMMLNSAADTGSAAIQRGDSLSTAMALALTHTVATGLTWDLPALKVGKTQLIPGIKSPNVAKRLAANIGGFLGVDAVSDALTKYILNNEAYKDAVQKYRELGRNPDLSLPKDGDYTTGSKDEAAADQTFTPSAAGVNILMATMATLLHTPEAQKIIDKNKGKNPPPPSPEAASPGSPPPPPGPSAQAAPPVAGTEPQADMPAPPATPDANGKFPGELGYSGPVPMTGNPQNAPPAAPAVASDLYEAAKKLIADGVRPSASTIGRKLKIPIADAGQLMLRMEKDGIVSTANASGKRTVLAKSAAPAESATAETTPVAPAAPQADNVPGTPAEPIPPGPDNQALTNSPESKPAGEPRFQAGDRRIVKLAGNEVPVVVAGDSVEGKVPVKLIDENGKVTKQIQNVAESAFVEPGAKAAPAEGKPAGVPSEVSSQGKSDLGLQSPAPAEASGSAPAEVKSEPPTPPAAEKSLPEPSKEGSSSATAESPALKSFSERLAAKRAKASQAVNEQEALRGDAAPVDNVVDHLPTEASMDAVLRNLDLKNQTAGLEKSREAFRAVEGKLRPIDQEQLEKRISEVNNAKNTGDRAFAVQNLRALLDHFVLLHGEPTETAEEALARSNWRPDATKSPLEQALDVHEKSQTSDTGKRADLPTRAAATSTLARAIESEAKAAKNIPDELRADAVRTAQAASKFDLKTPEQMKKAQGINHKKLDAADAELKRVAQNLINPEKADVRTPEQTADKKAATVSDNLKAKRAKEKTASAGRTSEAGKKAPDAKSAAKVQTLEAQVKEALKKPGDPITKQERVDKILGKGWNKDWETHQGDPIRAARARDKANAPVASGIPDIEDATKLKTPNKGEQAKIDKASSDFVNAGNEAAPVYGDKLESILREIFGDHHADHVDKMMELIRAQREDIRDQLAERGRPRKMSDDIEGEIGAPKGFDYRSDSGDELEDLGDIGKSIAASRYAQPWQDLHTKLINMWARLAAARGTGESFRAVDVLDHMLKVAPEGPIKDLIGQLRDATSDRVRITTVDQIPGKPTARGEYTFKDDSIALVADPKAIRAVNTRTILHEIVHAVTAKFVRKNPGHPLSKEINNLFNVARDRIGRLTEEAAANNVFVHSGQILNDNGSLSPKFLPQGDAYGLKNVYEFMAEAKVNPAFQNLLAKSEGFRSLYEGLRDVVTRIGQSVGKMLGIKRPDTARLLHNTLDVTDRIIQAQREMRELSEHADPFSTDNSRDTTEAVLRFLDDSDPHVPNEDEFRSAIRSNTATQLAGRFRRAIRSGAIGTVRDANRGLISHDQLVRTALRREVFGPDDETNPVRQWDEQLQQRNAAINKMSHGISQLVKDHIGLDYKDNVKLGQFMIDSTISGIDPTLGKADQVPRAQRNSKFDAMYDEMAARWKNFSDKQRSIYTRERDANERAAVANRKAGVDLALDTYADDARVTDAVRRALYSVDQPYQFEDLIGGRNSVLDLGTKENEKLVGALQDLASLHQIEGPYFHLGRNGDIVVHAKPTGTREFGSSDAAERFADTVRSLSPNSKAEVAKVGDSWQVDYKAEYTSMHETYEQAEQDIQRMRGLGIDVGNSATSKLNTEETSGALTHGIATLVADAERKLERNGESDASKEAMAALRNSFVQLVAAHSAYAGSRLARRGVGGVKPEEMARNFAKHMQSSAYNTGHMAYAFRIGEALGKIKNAVADNTVRPAVAYQRGAFYREMSRRMALDNQTYGKAPPLNSIMAKAGFWNYIASLGHIAVIHTQNFTTTGFVAMSRWGAYRGFNALNAAMMHVYGPTFRETYRALGLKTNAEEMIEGIMAGVRKSERFGKWAQGENSPLQQLIDRGALHVSMVNQLAETARGGNSTTAGRVYNDTQEWARIAPTMADMFNRVSTGLAALELTKGDIYKAGDFIKETHMDYSAENKPRFFKQISRFPLGSSVTMFHTYTQGMFHLLYSHALDGIGGMNPRGRAEGLKTVAGLMLGATLFGGLSQGVGLEPIRLMRYVWNKLAGDSDQYSTFDTMMEDFVKSIAGKGAVADMLNHGILANPITNVDISYRLGLSDLLMHDPPDILSLGAGHWGDITKSLFGAGIEQFADTSEGLYKGLIRSDTAALMKVIPFKMARDVMNAMQPDMSIRDRAITAAGLAPNDQRKIQNNISTDIDYQKWAKQRQQDLIQSYMNTNNKAKVINEMVKFSRENPSMKITPDKIRQEMMYKQLDARQKAGLPGRDTVRNQLNDH